MTSLIHPVGSRRRWFRVRLGGLMILVLIVGLAWGWVVTTIRRQREAIAAVVAAGGGFEFDYQIDGVDALGLPIWNRRTEPSAPRWVRQLLGNELFQTVRGASVGDLRSTEVLSMLPRFDQLEWLHLQGTSPLATNFEPLRRLPRLRRLSIWGPGVTDAVLADVAAIRGLKSLSIYGSPATDTGFSHLASLANLTQLMMPDNPHLSDAGLARMLAGMHRLQTFWPETSDQPRVVTAAALANHCPDLRDLMLQGPGITDAELVSLGSLTQLRKLNLSMTKVTGTGLVYLARLKHLAELQLVFADLADADLPPLAGLSSLQTLDLRGNSAITDQGLRALAACQTLQFLQVDQTRVTSAGVAALQAALPTVRISTENLLIDPPPAVETP